MRGAIVFTDIVGSSKLWKKHENAMSVAMRTYERRVRKIIDQHDGLVVKTIGDAFMVLFKGKWGYINALGCAMGIQLDLDRNRVKVSPRKWIKLRIGICQGHFEEQKVRFQDCDLKDYYGQTVNIASRMESVVAGANDIALAFNEKHDDEDVIDVVADLTRQNGSKWDITVELFNNQCKPEKGISCFPEEKLHGVGKVRAYLLTPP